MHHFSSDSGMFKSEDNYVTVGHFDFYFQDISVVN